MRWHAVIVGQRGIARSASAAKPVRRTQAAFGEPSGQGARRSGSRAVFEAIRALKDESESVERALAERSQELKTEGLTRDAGLIDVQRALPDDSALISLYRVERLEPSALTPAGAARRQADGSRLSVASYFAFVLRSNSLIQSLCLLVPHSRSTIWCVGGMPLLPLTSVRRVAHRKKSCVSRAPL